MQNLMMLRFWLPDYITLRNDEILMTCIIKDDGKFYPQYFKKNHCLLNKFGIQQDDEIGACQKMRKRNKTNVCWWKLA